MLAVLSRRWVFPLLRALFALGTSKKDSTAQIGISRSSVGRMLATRYVVGHRKPIEKRA